MRARAILPWLPLVVATVMLARAATAAVLDRLGHPGAALDDAYIHFQYARAIAEGHPFRYQAGEPISTGATSILWPAVLAPFHALGFRGEALLWPTWALSFAALGALAREAYLLSRPLAGRAAAIGAGAMTLLFGGLVWGAASGMEVTAFAWLIALGARRASEWAEAPPACRTRRGELVLLAIAAAAPLTRPEGALTSLALGFVVLAFPRGGRPLARAETLAFVAAAALPNLLLLALTGHATSSTAQVKLLLGNPYYATRDAVVANARLLVTSILDGDTWSTEFLPKGGAPVALAGLGALVVRGAATRRPARAALVMALALAMFVPCLYVTFLWNRLRYLWPFAPGWFVGLACLARVLAGLAARIDARAGGATAGLLAGALAGALAMRLEWVLDDVAQSASGIGRQQVALGHWVRANLPADARVGVNDTGAIAYFGDRRTFDVVGLTTPTEGRYWVAGAGSRLEHYERLKVASPSLLPTHFVVYPEWMACPPVLGRELHEAVVRDASILGGQAMKVYEARLEHLGSGELPWTARSERIVDVVDVADLESEDEHSYALLGARDGEQVAEGGNAPDGAIVVDGGRTRRTHERFIARLPAGRPTRMIARVASPGGTRLAVRAADRELGELDLPAGPWVELAYELPADVAGEHTQVEVLARDGRFSSFHYWFVEP